ncbi:uncharacterized protein EI90DRAFT_2573428 [Cantharellus anzutake]|uniref:uncharacterized protein n=1 Tax=Cantharellus anzutake TaxID=1750568 RepID=UPI001908D0D5|nr:uncharacterized protein EI90DRAFT_2573428 [Cantharellus anzutake]KAF8338322.1 hypothetical protein EI90DRAFT_2573428 [Cantharellus anzutake]
MELSARLEASRPPPTSTPLLTSSMLMPASALSSVAQVAAMSTTHLLPRPLLRTHQHRHQRRLQLTPHAIRLTLGCNEIDIWVWLNDLYAKVIVYIDLLDGKNDPHEPCLKIISEIDSAIALLADIKIDLTHDHGNKCNDIIGLLIDLVVKLVVGLSKYSLTVSIGILTKLDICLCNLFIALNVYINGIAKLFGNSLTDLSIFIKLGLRLTLKICGLL